MASSGHSYLPPLTEEDRTIFINRRIIDKISFILVEIACWCSNKKQNQSFEDYLENDRSIPKLRFKNYFRATEDLDKLKQTDYDNLDVTFLCQLLHALCDGISDVGKWNKISDSTKLEYHLNLIKNLRNAVMHGPDGEAKNIHFPNKVENVALNVLDIAGRKFSRTDDEINKVKDDVKKLISDIKSTVLTEKEEGSLQYQRLIVPEGIPELRKKVQAFKANSSPYFHHITGFYYLNLSYQVEEDGHGSDKSISCKEIFKHAEENGTKILIIEGQSGAGKTSLMKHIQADLLQIDGKPRKFVGSEIYQIPLFFSCRSLTCRTIAELIQETFPSLSAKLELKDLEEVALSQTKCVFLVDGLDEMNDVSKEVVEHILRFLSNHTEAICIFSTRPHTARNFEERLRSERLSFETLSLKELQTNVEQRNFLLESCENGSTVSEAYENSKLNLQSPVLLGLYSFLFFLDPEMLLNCTSPVHIMQATIEYGIRVVKERLSQKKILDYEYICRKILERIYFISFCCLLKRKYKLETAEIEYLRDETREICAAINIHSLEILSCLFPSCLTDNTSDSIEFYHKSQQELVAGLYVARQMMKTGKTFLQIVCDAIKKYEFITDTVVVSDFPAAPEFLKR